MVKYRRRTADERPKAMPTPTILEVTWTVIPTILCAFVFVWSSSLYFENSRPPNASSEIFVVGKQWMWHLQHPEGPREINELHVPVGVPMKLTMTSEDVIHDFFDSRVPHQARRDSRPLFLDLVSGHEDRDVSLFLRAVLRRRTCRNDRMGLRDDADGLRAMAERAAARARSMEQSGERLFTQVGCITCHGPMERAAGRRCRASTGSP